MTHPHTMTVWRSIIKAKLWAVAQFLKIPTPPKMWDNPLTHYSLKLLLFSHIVMSDTLWHHGLKHIRLSCPLLSPWVYSNSCPLNQWCHPTISSSVSLFYSCSQLSPALRSFPMFASADQNTGASALASVLPMSIQGWFPLRLTGLFSLLSKGLSRVFSSTTVGRHWFFGALPSLQSSSHNDMRLLKRLEPWLYRLLSAEYASAFQHCVELRE